MSVDPPRAPQHFYITTPLPCPYLEGRLERKVITELRGPDADRLHQMLSQAGFRRSHSIAYIPACPNCSACVPVRVDLDHFRQGRSLRRIVNRNADLTVMEIPPLATDEQFLLFERYQHSRHADGDMARMDFRDYQAMIEDTTVSSFLIELRNADGVLAGLCLCDRLADGLSAVYSFFDPALERRSLGSLMVLILAEQARVEGLRYVYLGYWIRDCRKMSYKTRFGPLQALGQDRWQRLNSDSETGL